MTHVWIESLSVTFILQKNYRYVTNETLTRQLQRLIIPIVHTNSNPLKPQRNILECLRSLPSFKWAKKGKHICVSSFQCRFNDEKMIFIIIMCQNCHFSSLKWRVTILGFCQGLHCRWRSRYCLLLVVIM